MHECFEKMKERHGTTEPFEQPIVFEKETLDMKALPWHVKTPKGKGKKSRYFRIEYCPFCGEGLRGYEGGGARTDG